MRSEGWRFPLNYFICHYKPMKDVKWRVENWRSYASNIHLDPSEKFSYWHPLFWRS